MSHTTRDKPKLLARVRRLRGQVEAVERALEAEAGCPEILQLTASIRGALNGLTAELIEHHIRSHVLDADGRSQPEQVRGAEELIEVIHTYLK
jgi:DNA-binding FrmR family transcriptional regulator